MIFVGNSFNHFGFRCVFASSFFLFNKCVTKARLALSRMQSNPAFRTPALPVPGVRIVECGAKEGREKKTGEKKMDGERRNACEICFQKVIPPTLSASNPNLVSGVKSCQSSNGWQTAMFTEFWKNMPVFTFYICFLQANISLTSKNERTGKHFKLVPLPLSLIFTQQIIYYVATVGFCCYYWNAVWICLSVKSSTRIFRRRVKRIEISKARPETSAIVPFHKISFQNIQLNVLTASFQEFQG